MEKSNILQSIDKIKNKFKFQECYRAYSKAIGAVGLLFFINSVVTRKTLITYIEDLYTI